MTGLDDNRVQVSRMLDLSGKVAVVSGASRGIGQGIAQRLAEAGADVVVGYRSDEEGAQETVEAVKAQGRRAAAVGADVTLRSGAEALLDAATARLGRLDVVVNNAGVYPLKGLLEMTDDEWREVLDSNLTSVFLMTQVAGRLMKMAGTAGSIVNVASIEGMAPAPAHSHYAAAKAGVIMHTRSAALELGEHGIRVNAVAPGLTFYPELPTLWPDGVARYEAAAPLSRLVSRGEVADACLFLASPGASGISGSCITVDAGVAATPMF